MNSKQFPDTDTPIVVIEHGQEAMEKGGKVLTQSEGFYVKDTEGPLKEGEPARSKKNDQPLKNNRFEPKLNLNHYFYIYPLYKTSTRRR